MREELVEQVLYRIEHERQLKAARIRLFVSVLSFFGLLILAVPTWQMTRTDIINSGFGQQFNLMFYDFRNILNYWQDFSVGLMEELPVLSVVQFLAVLAGLVFALKVIFKNGKVFIKYEI
ncbi:MAG: hypothetical protein JWO40_319 [Candidatus Doudnabacteria bacterium]|nr:hypothetical protein [Candidatus Doudnabacteria bacterium]